MVRQEKADPHIANAQPLRGKTVLITRPKDQADEFARVLQDRGASVVFVPTIQIVPPSSWKECDAAIDIIETYDGFIFTSANAVREFFRRLERRKPMSARPLLKKRDFFVVGEKTSDALAGEGLKPTRFSNVNNGRELADAMLARPLHGKTLLFPKGNLAGEELPKALKAGGAIIDEVIVYDTITPRDGDARSVRENLETDSIDIVTFFSASSVKHLLTLVTSDILSSKTIAVIGNSTASAVKEFGLKADIIAPKPTAVDLAHAIANYYSTNREHR